MTETNTTINKPCPILYLKGIKLNIEITTPKVRFDVLQYERQFVAAYCVHAYMFTKENVPNINKHCIVFYSHAM